MSKLTVSHSLSMPISFNILIDFLKLSKDVDKTFSAIPFI
jgi:hypothetical protein